MALQDTALRLIQKFGESRQVELLIPAAAPADPSKPWDVNPTSSTTSKKVPAVVVPIKRSLIDGVSIKQGDETILIAGLSLPGIEPSTDSKVLDEEVQKNIVDVGRVKPGKTDFLWKLQVRAP